MDDAPDEGFNPCKDYQELIDDYVVNALSPECAQDIEAHMGKCWACTEYHQDARELTQDIKDTINWHYKQLLKGARSSRALFDTKGLKELVQQQGFVCCIYTPEDLSVFGAKERFIIVGAVKRVGQQKFTLGYALKYNREKERVVIAKGPDYALDDVTVADIPGSIKTEVRGLEARIQEYIPKINRTGSASDQQPS